ncbi:hypothetical protein [Undibacterium sp.]|uniref:hypothetical protein n=1 Tax=Undibacterium sp. TaxID=1914977 RepID=UPI002B642C3C|nr:hypothetical protein [Undibacterium sp.]HTD07153.1 hypothetical protein [Undibacterium sp.]
MNPGGWLAMLTLYETPLGILLGKVTLVAFGGTATVSVPFDRTSPAAAKLLTLAITEKVLGGAGLLPPPQAERSVHKRIIPVAGATFFFIKSSVINKYLQFGVTSLVFPKRPGVLKTWKHQEAFDDVDWRCAVQ